MNLVFYYASGSPYAWRVWLALEHKQLPYEMKLLSFSAGDLLKPAYLAINPRHRVPAIVDDGFSLYESAAIMEYLEDQYPHAGQRLFPTSVQERAIARRLIREADQYLAGAMEKLVEQILFKPAEQWDAEAIAVGKKEFAAELEQFERNVAYDEFFAGAAGAVDFTVYPLIALALRMERSKPDLGIRATLGPNLAAWMNRVEKLPYFAKTLPPHWQQA